MSPKIKMKRLEPKFREDQYILRATPEIAEHIRNLIRNGHKKMNMWIEMYSQRGGWFYIEMNKKLEKIPCRVVDIPTIIETYKSIDHEVYYKSGNCSQLIEIGVESKDEDYTKPYPHGITGSMKNIRDHWDNLNPPLNSTDLDYLHDEFKCMIEEEDREERTTWEIIDADEYDRNHPEETVPEEKKPVQEENKPVQEPKKNNDDDDFLSFLKESETKNTSEVKQDEVLKLKVTIPAKVSQNDHDKTAGDNSELERKKNLLLQLNRASKELKETRLRVEQLTAQVRDAELQVEFSPNVILRETYEQELAEAQNFLNQENQKLSKLESLISNLKQEISKLES